jgi:uncharacterized protein (DUF1499 family)
LWKIRGGVLFMPLLSFPGNRPSYVGDARALPAPCPASPNCVSSEASDQVHGVPVFILTAPPAEAWEALCAAVSALPRATVITRTPEYIHAECQSRIFGFIDDLELRLCREKGQVGARSASRLGYYDFGVNRRRVERLRRMLRVQGIVS